jgi:hypothetical protein
MQFTKSSPTRSIVELLAAAVVILPLTLGAFAADVMPEAKIKPTVTFTGAPASAMNGSTFTVVATTNASTTAVITAAPSTVCSVTGDTVTITANKGTCTLTASWPADSQYLAAKAKQKTTATLGYTGQVIYDFGSASGDGTSLEMNGMVVDKSGNIYYNARNGGLGYGSIFELTPNGQGGWTQTDIHDFNPQSTNGIDGSSPFGMLAIDSKGNLYGTASEGGSGPCTAALSAGCGIVYELSPPAVPGGEWTETILYNFGASSTDGIRPLAGVTLGNTTGTILYGTTYLGGTGTAMPGYPGLGAGTIWELSYAKATKKWTESILYNFTGISSGQYANYGASGGLLLNGGNLYGKACNQVFELASSGATWSFNTLYQFGGAAQGGWCNSEAANQGTVAMDSKKNIYGTAAELGVGSGGTAWELVNSNGTYTEQTIYNFPADVGYPDWGLVYSGGSWYGATGGWPGPSDGIVFKLTYSASTGWTETTIYDQFFADSGSAYVDNPGINQLIVDTKGNLYGIGDGGGIQSGSGYGMGGVFEVSPMP